MRRPVSILLVVVFAVALVSGFCGSRASAASNPSGIKVDLSLKVDPYLQVGALLAPSKRVQVIVQKTHPSVDSHGLAKSVGASVQEEFPFVRGLALEIPMRAAVQLARQPGVKAVSVNGAVRLTSVDTSKLKTTYQEAVGVTQVWNGSREATGKGVTVAILDSGVNHNHAALTDVVQFNVNSSSTTSDDPHGHGTHVAGIITGNDPQGRYIGVAPDARVISVRIADDQGNATEADVLRGLQWVFDNRSQYNIRAVNLSLSSSVASSYKTSSISAGVEQLWFAGVVVVAAGGNRGSASDAMWFAPGNDPYVITVGGLDHNETAATADDSLASWSGRGTTQDGYYKPELVAPARRIVAPLAGPNSVLATQMPDRIVDGDYLSLSGTSMAAPIVTGVVALLLERYPNLTPDQVKWLLTNTTNTYPGQADRAGVVNPAGALQAAGGTVGTSNQGLTPNSQIDSSTGTVSANSQYWESLHWQSLHWQSAEWESIHWISIHWIAIYVD